MGKAGEMKREREKKDDGRYLSFYTFEDEEAEDRLNDDPGEREAAS